jgi:hypothetical protein
LAAWFAVLSLDEVVLRGGGGYGLVAGFEGELIVVTYDPKVQVRPGASRERVEDAFLPDHGFHRLVRVLVSVRR